MKPTTTMNRYDRSRLTAALGLVFSLFVLLPVREHAHTPTIPLGSYTAVVSQDVRVGNLNFLGGEYQLTLLEGGKYQLGRNNFITLSGTYTVSGDQVRFASPATMDNCSGQGAYQFTVAGNRLTLTAANTRTDSCVERIVSLTAAPFFKDDPTVSLWRNIGPTGGQFNAVMIHDGRRRAHLGGQRANVAFDAGHSRGHGL